jgi:hypothetical protein
MAKAAPRAGDEQPWKRPPTCLGAAQPASDMDAMVHDLAEADVMIAKLEDERDGYRMGLEIVWEAITPTMMEEQLANFIAGYVRTALDNPTSTIHEHHSARDAQRSGQARRARDEGAAMRGADIGGTP